jgi:hypothetical protein
MVQGKKNLANATRKRTASSLTHADSEHVDKQDSVCTSKPVPPPVETFNLTYKALRPALSLLDRPVSHSFIHKGTWISLEPYELQQMYDKRRKAMLGQQRITEWASGRAQPIGGTTKGACYLVWFCLPGKPLKLPAFQLCGVKSAVRNGGFDVVYLIVFQKLSNVPTGVILLDGNEYVKEEVVLGWVELHFHIAHIADYIRILAISRTSHDAAWFYDCDPVHIRSGWPCKWGFLGFTFGTYTVNPGGIWNKYPEKKLRQLSMDYCTKPRDSLKFSTPCRFVKGAPMLGELCESMEGYFAAGIPATNYDLPFMIPMKEAIVAWGLEKAFAPSDAYCIMSYWDGQQPIKAGSEKHERRSAKFSGAILKGLRG